MVVISRISGSLRNFSGSDPGLGYGSLVGIPELLYQGVAFFPENPIYLSIRALGQES